MTNLLLTEGPAWTSRHGHTRGLSTFVRLGLLPCVGSAFAALGRRRPGVIRISQLAPRQIGHPILIVAQELEFVGLLGCIDVSIVERS
jgi:hypothetical protein